ncbi:DUF3784 domain-containing protein [Nocardia pseudobrasiliensis]|uniref:Uncharacterized protein n=1 Tax=Nocardia pseudobrasiliensis TaxID=45979 RepID=A0A370I3K7_9NOCA|nr:DUF3784 domain-containing protein [Nocardia pseudobrasiliensis]RDI65328.1 hypothetical protein DFR76_106198 [Nocardia pseudobrasiliensis]
MLVLTLVLAAIGFALLVTALTTGSVVWAWGCIVVCVIGAVLLLVSALSMRDTVDDLQAGPGRHAKRVTPTRGAPTRHAHPGESPRYRGRE